MRKLLGAVAALAFVAGTAGAQNIVQNPGFENGTNVAPWVIVPGPNNQWAAQNSDPHSGQWAAGGGCVGPECVSTSPDRLFQDLVTTAGHGYNLSYWFHDDGIPFELKVFWNGGLVQDLTGPSNLTYQQFGVNGLIATGATTRLEFWERQDPGYNRLDDVSVIDSRVAAVPEPASLTLLATGLAGVFGAARRRRKTANVV